MDLLNTFQSPSIDYSKMKILVVDDFPSMQGSFRSALSLMKVSKITTVSSAAEAIYRVKNEVFNGILCDYNLGDKRDGQHLLEEMRHCEYISLSTAFLMVTAETTYERVVAAAELAPDDYIIKPFTPHILKSRMDSIFAEKGIFSRVHEQIEKKNLGAAIGECNAIMANVDVIKKNPRYLINTIRLKCQLLINMGQYAEAEELYKKIIERRAIPWARLGLVRTLHLRGKDDMAEMILRDVIGTNPEMITCHDLLADIQERQGNREELQKTLQRGIEISPKSLPRQRRLGDVAVQNGDDETAEKAYKKLTEEKHSYHFRPADMAKLTKTYLRQGKTTAAEEFMERERSFLYTTEEGKLVVSTNMVEISLKQGKEDLAKRHMRDALNIAERCMDADQNLLIDVVGACLKTGMSAEATVLSQKISQKNKDNPQILQGIQNTYDGAGMKNPDAVIDLQILKNLETSGLESLRKNDFDGAYNQFHEAVQLAPKHQGTLLNFVNMLLYALEKKGVDGKLIMEGRNMLQRAKGINPQDVRFQAVNKKWEDLEKAQKTQGIIF